MIQLYIIYKKYDLVLSTFSFHFLKWTKVLIVDIKLIKYCEHFHIVQYAYEGIKTFNIHWKYIER